MQELTSVLLWNDFAVRYIHTTCTELKLFHHHRRTLVQTLQKAFVQYVHQKLCAAGVKTESNYPSCGRGVKVSLG